MASRDERPVPTWRDEGGEVAWNESHGEQRVVARTAARRRRPTAARRSSARDRARTPLATEVAAAARRLFPFQSRAASLRQLCPRSRRIRDFTLNVSVPNLERQRDGSTAGAAACGAACSRARSHCSQLSCRLELRRQLERANRTRAASRATVRVPRTYRNGALESQAGGRPCLAWVTDTATVWPGLRVAVAHRRPAGSSRT